MEIAQEVHPVDHRDQGVQACEIRKAAPAFVAKGKGLGDR